VEEVDRKDSREVLGSDFVVGATGCGVVDELVRDFDAYF